MSSFIRTFIAGSALLSAFGLASFAPALGAWGPWSSWTSSNVAGVQFRTKCDNTPNPDGSGKYEWLLELQNGLGTPAKVDFVLTEPGRTPQAGEWAGTTLAPGQIQGSELGGMWWWLNDPCPGTVSVWLRTSSY